MEDQSALEEAFDLWIAEGRVLFEPFFLAVYPELLRRAVFNLNDSPLLNLLEAEDLVSGLYVRFARMEEPNTKSLAHFFNLAEKAMREMVIDQKRRESSKKRGGGKHSPEARFFNASVARPQKNLGKSFSQ